MVKVEAIIGKLVEVNSLKRAKSEVIDFGHQDALDNTRGYVRGSRWMVLRLRGLNACRQ